MKEKITRMMKEHGFLLFLFMCVCLVAASTIFIITKEVDKPEDNKELVILEEDEKGGVDITEELTTDVTAIDKDNSEEDVLETASKEEEPSEEDTDEEAPQEVMEEEPIEEPEEEVEVEIIQSQEAKAPEVAKDFIKPIEGEVITVFTTDSLIYSKTLDEWRGHSGIDIKGDLGGKVKAVKGGTVKKVEEDKLWGITVVIDHGNGLETKYANLGTKEMVKEGVQVKQGDYIGTVGKTATIEMLMDSHLHFEVIKDGKLVDPRSILE